MKKITFITLLLSIITFTSWGQCTADANFGFNPSFNSNPNSYDFHILDSNNVCGVFWDFGDGNISYNFHPVNIFNAPGTYNVCLVVTSCDQTPCYDTVCQAITIQIPSTGCNLDSSFIASVSQINNLNYSFGLNDTANVCSYNWSFGDGSNSNQPYPNHTYNQSGTYNVCLTISSCDSNCIDTFCQTLNVQGQNNGCNMDTAFISFPSQTNNLDYSFALNNNSNTCSYFWDFGDGTNSNQAYPSHSFNQPGTYNVCLTIGSCDQTPCYDTICQTITITNSGCNITSSFNYSTSPITQPLTYDFTPVDTTGIVAYFWSFGDGSTGSTSSSPVYTYSQPGTYNVCLIATSANGCSDTTCMNIPINSNPCNVSAAFNATMSNNDSLAYTFNLLDSTSGCSIFWDFGDGTSGQGDFASHTFSQAGTYTICASIWSCPNNCADTVCQTIVINGTSNPCNLTANYQWFQLYDSLNGNWVNAVYVVNFSTIGSNVNYYWDFGDGNSSTLTFPSHTYANIGSYQICLTITDNQGCTASYCDSIYVQTKASGFTLNVISEDQASVGIEEKNNIQLGNIYPNPTSDNATITINAIESSNISVSIIDLSSKIISQEMINVNTGVNTIQLNTANLRQGMYFVSISDRESINTNLRLIKK